VGLRASVLSPCAIESGSSAGADVSASPRCEARRRSARMIPRSLVYPNSSHQRTGAIAVYAGPRSISGSLSLSLSPRFAEDSRAYHYRPRLASAGMVPRHETVSTLGSEYRALSRATTRLDLRRLPSWRGVSRSFVWATASLHCTCPGTGRAKCRAAGREILDGNSIVLR